MKTIKTIKTIKKIKMRLMLMLLLILSLAACNQVAPPTASPVTPPAVATATSEPAATVIPAATRTSEPTTAPTATPAPTETPTVEPTARPTLDPAALDKSTRNIKQKNLPTCVVDGVTLRIDLYRLPEVKGPTPTIIYIHGGAWMNGSKKGGYGLSVMPQLVVRGYSFIAITYRLAPEAKFPAMIEDIKCNIRFLRAHAAEYNLDPTRFGILGNSAGGHLAALAAVTDERAGFDGAGGYAEQSSRVQVAVDMYGPTDLTAPEITEKPEFKRMIQQVFGLTDSTSDLLWRASPLFQVTPDDPPTLIVHGEQDTTVPLQQSQRFYDQLKAAGVPTELILVKNAAHGLVPEGGELSPSIDEVNRRIADFFDRYLRLNR